jgi:heme/copper-type cytochrome/quinol oxidase subunit 2
MKRIGKYSSCIWLVMMAAVVCVLANPGSASACASCYGKSDSPLAAGMNWGIFSLLVVVGGVMGTVASFFIFLARKAESVAEGEADGASSGTLSAQQFEKSE